ncbi:hypothetical protein Taro_016068 [Colocasia esculenta]|uniref:Uncharacterized protein n=1 Tax=Colocasia esculenta TaxID=4460 RepID=A0A843UP69_COLES|nr:hypothetical protein [Colocasia esculenta]
MAFFFQLSTRIASFSTLVQHTRIASQSPSCHLQSDTLLLCTWSAFSVCTAICVSSHARVQICASSIAQPWTHQIRTPLTPHGPDLVYITHPATSASNPPASTIASHQHTITAFLCFAWLPNACCARTCVARLHRPPVQQIAAPIWSASLGPATIRACPSPHAQAYTHPSRSAHMLPAPRPGTLHQPLHLPSCFAISHRRLNAPGPAHGSSSKCAQIWTAIGFCLGPLHSSQLLRQHQDPAASVVVCTPELDDIAGSDRIQEGCFLGLLQLDLAIALLPSFDIHQQFEILSLPNFVENYGFEFDIDFVVLAQFGIEENTGKKKLKKFLSIEPENPRGEDLGSFYRPHGLLLPTFHQDRWLQHTRSAHQDRHVSLLPAIFSWIPFCCAPGPPALYAPPSACLSAHGSKSAQAPSPSHGRTRSGRLSHRMALTWSTSHTPPPQHRIHLPAPSPAISTPSRPSSALHGCQTPAVHEPASVASIGHLYNRSPRPSGLHRLGQQPSEHARALTPRPAHTPATQHTCFQCRALEPSISHFICPPASPSHTVAQMRQALHTGAAPNAPRSGPPSTSALALSTAHSSSASIKTQPPQFDLATTTSASSSFHRL